MSSGKQLRTNQANIDLPLHMNVVGSLSCCFFWGGSKTNPCEPLLQLTSCVPRRLRTSPLRKRNRTVLKVSGIRYYLFSRWCSHWCCLALIREWFITTLWYSYSALFNIQTQALRGTIYINDFLRAVLFIMAIYKIKVVNNYSPLNKQTNKPHGPNMFTLILIAMGREHGARTAHSWALFLNRLGFA